MAQVRSASGEFARLLRVVRELRRRCPWDREQTGLSLAPHLIEEAYESADAIERANDHDTAEELGDLLAQTLLIATIAEERGRGSVAELLAAAREKLVRRHPHVYGDGRHKVASVGAVLKNWAATKQRERRKRGHNSALAGVARNLPALSLAQKLGERARVAGMDWADAAAVLAKVEEELKETARALAADDREQATEEAGDMMLALANLPRFLGADAEQTLRAAARKFIERFEGVERLCRERGLKLKRLSSSSIDRLWNEAKRRRRNPRRERRARL